MKRNHPLDLSHLLAVVFLAVSTLVATGCVSSQVTDPIEIDRQVASAGADMEITARLATRLAIVSIDPDDRAKVARVMRDVASIVLDAATPEHDPDAPAHVADLTEMLLDGRGGEYSAIVRDLYALLRSRMSDEINRRFGTVDLKTRDRIIHGLIVGASRGVRDVSAEFLAQADSPPTNE